MVENSKRRCVALAFQGGVIPAGTFAAGVVKALVDCNAFDKYDICTFSGTSSGALVAAMCWGHSLKEGGIKDLPKALSDLWLDIAFGTFPNEVLAQGFILGSQAARATPLGDFIIQNMGMPFVRRGFEEWVSKHIQFEAWRDLFRKRLTMKSSEGLHAPSLLMGATDVLEGEAKVFRVREPEDFRLETVLACGSIEETNGLTIIKDGPHEGVYMDGAWSVNPPLSALIDYSIDEIWLVQVFPKRRAQVPMKPAERQDRRDELWQTSLIEHELKIINFVNEHLEALKADNHYRHINVEVIQMERDLPWGATIFNTRTFVEDMIDYGYHQAHRLLERKENSLTRTRPPRD